MTVERGIEAKLRYRWDEFSSGGVDLWLYVPLGRPPTFEHLVRAARAYGATAMGIPIFENGAGRPSGFVSNRAQGARTASFVPKPKGRPVVPAEDDG